MLLSGRDMDTELLMRILAKETLLTEIFQELGADDFRDRLLLGGREANSFWRKTVGWKVKWEEIKGFSKKIENNEKEGGE